MLSGGVLGVQAGALGTDVLQRRRGTRRWGGGGGAKCQAVSKPKLLRTGGGARGIRAGGTRRVVRCRSACRSQGCVYVSKVERGIKWRRQLLPSRG